MQNNEQKGNILFKKLDLAFVYLFIFLAGIAIVMIMTSYLNKKVEEFSSDSIAITEPR